MQIVKNLGVSIAAIALLSSTHAWSLVAPDIGGYGFSPPILPIDTNGFTDQSGTSEWIASDITSQNPLEIGSAYIQTVYDANSQSIIQNVWEYNPGFSTYNLPVEINLAQNINTISQAGWILKEQRIGVVKFSDGVMWDKEYMFNYDYNKDEEGDWGLVLNIEDQSDSQIVKSIVLTQSEINVEDIKDVDSLINMVTYQPDNGKRNEIITRIEGLVNEGIGSNEDLKLANYISDLLYDEDAYVRSSAASELKDIRAIEPLIIALEDEFFYVRDQATDVLVKIGEPAIEPLIKALRNDSFHIRTQTTSALVKIGASAVPALIIALRDASSDIRYRVAYVLGGIGDIRAVEPLIETLGDEFFHVSAQATDVLVKIGEPAIEPLIKALRNASSDIRYRVAYVLGGIGDIRAVEPLIEALGDASSNVRHRAVYALGEIGDIRAVEPLIEALGDASSNVRAQAISALVKIRASTVEPLIEALGDASSNVRAQAIDVLVKIGASTVEPLIIALNNPNLRVGAKETLISIGNPSFIPVLGSLLNSDNINLQQQAVDIIKGIAENKIDQESGIDPAIDIVSLKSMSKEDLKNIVSNNEYSITRAMALYYMGKNYQDEEFLRNYIFNEDTDGKLSVRNESVSKLEMAAILNTGMPAQAEWWDSLADRGARISYIELVLKGDFTDERHYIEENRAWVCVQYATQFVMNCRGWSEENFADQEAFEEYGAGYVTPSIDYGMPAYYADTFTYTENSGHAFNAIFIGDAISNSTQRRDINNWIFIEPMDDDFSPNLLGETVIVSTNPFFLPDGHNYGEYTDTDTIKIETLGYSYGADYL